MLAKWGKGKIHNIWVTKLHGGEMMTKPPEFVNQTPKEFILSVPAIWSDQAKDKTMDCALNAGFGGRNQETNIRLISEPEAAAVYTIMTVSNCASRCASNMEFSLNP
jgi:hypothetical protein